MREFSEDVVRLLYIIVCMENIKQPLADVMQSFNFPYNFCVYATVMVELAKREISLYGLGVRFFPIYLQCS